MGDLTRRAEELARAEQQRKVAEIAERLKSLVRGASVQVEDAQILVSGRGLLKRWLTDPSLRFLSGGLK